jgi:hypothetical protein
MYRPVVSRRHPAAIYGHNQCAARAARASREGVNSSHAAMPTLRKPPKNHPVRLGISKISFSIRGHFEGRKNGG